MDLDLSGKTVLITGASKGIGQAAALAFAREGCNLYLSARSAERLDQVRDEVIGTHAVTVTTFPKDLSTPKSMIELAEACQDADILINNAGDVSSGPLDSLSDDDWRVGFNLKVFGYVTLTRELYQHMRVRKSGVIINDIGNSGENWDANYIAGSTGNAALMSFTKALGGASLNDGVRVVGVNPGPVATDRMLKLMKRRALDWYGDESRWEELFEKYPGGRPATPEEVADLMVFLASPKAGYITGTNVTIDGGISARGSII